MSSAALALLAAAAPAHAATLEYRPSTGAYSDLTYRAAPSETNRVTATREGDTIRIRDDGAPIEVTGDCQRSGPEVVCRVANAGVHAIPIELGDGDDTLDWGIGYALVDGGAGDDRIVAPGGRVEGGPGGDTIEAQVVSYEARTAGVRATLDDRANDGEPGEGDDLRGGPVLFEGGAGDDLLSAGAADGSAPRGESINIVGNGGNDRIFGAGGGNLLAGGAGDDEIEAMDGDDAIRGGPGADAIGGGGGTDQVLYDDSAEGVRVTADAGAADDGMPGEGDDVTGVEDLYGSRYTDVLVGNDGANRIQGGPMLDERGTDTILGLGGNDTIEVLNAERVNAGPGRDHVIADAVRTLELRDGEPDSAQCVRGAASMDLDDLDEARGCVFAALEFRTPRYVRTGRDRRVDVTAECNASLGRGCDGAVRLLAEKSGALLASGPFHLERFQTATIRLKLRAAGRRALRRGGRRTVRAVAVHQAPVGPPVGRGPFDLLRTTWVIAPKRWPNARARRPAPASARARAPRGSAGSRAPR